MSEAPAPPGLSAPLEPAGFQRHLPVALHQLTESITPQRDLFTIAHYGIARVDAAAWRMTVEGLVERPLSLNLDELRRLPKRQVQSFHQCAGFPNKPDIATRRIANVVWGGADLGDLLGMTGIRPEARFLWTSGLDRGRYERISAGNYQKDMPLDRLAQGGVLLAYEINGEPLAAEHGAPVRLVIPGYYGTNAVKWLFRLELADRRAGGIFTTVLYNDPVAAPDGSAAKTRPVWAAPPEAAIVSPAPETLLPRQPVEIWGWAWGADDIERVEISADNGESWHVASVGPRSEWSWQRFSYRWTPESYGAFTLMARAHDSAGATQPMARARNAVHAIRVKVGP